MRKNGFTLIELLAVIVILAIIALIAVPIVLGIISDSKESATLRGAEYYLDAVDIAIMDSMLKNEDIRDGEYTILENGNLCHNSNMEDEKCNKEIIVAASGEMPNSGKITIDNGKVDTIILNYAQHDSIIKDNNGDIKPLATLSSVCSLSETSTETGTNVGAEYICNLGTDSVAKNLTFYVLQSPTDADPNVYLIMNNNISSDGTLNNKNLPYIGNDGSLNEPYGMVEFSQVGETTPTLALAFLKKATKKWDKLVTSQIALPTKEQIEGHTDTIVDELWGPSYYLNKDWLYNSTDFSDSIGYWTATHAGEDSAYAVVITINTEKGTKEAILGGMIQDAAKNGVRPVIILK